MHNTFYQNFLINQKKTHRLRSLPQSSVGFNLDFSTNDYLGLACDPSISKAIIHALDENKVGSTGSRLLSGDHVLYHTLEKMIASDKGMEKALYFSSGFLANYSCLYALFDNTVLKDKPIVFFDKRNHNSLYQAVFSSQIELVRYKDLSELEEKIKNFSNDNRPKFLVTETVFGMDGDCIDIQRVYNLAKCQNLFVILDEAHATGIIGPCGLGLSKAIDWTGVDILIIGTFSKALGLMGAYAASNALVIDYLINKAPGFIYSTSTPPCLIAGCIKAWELNKNSDDKRKKLFENVKYFKEGLKTLGFETDDSLIPIIPIILKKEDLALQKKQQLLEKGINVSCVRAPTVPLNSARLRIALTALHETEDLDQLLVGLK